MLLHRALRQRTIRRTYGRRALSYGTLEGVNQHLDGTCCYYERVLAATTTTVNYLSECNYQSPRKNSGFSVIKNVARGDDVDTLCHTLYRFTVLFGLPGQNPSESKGIDKVWQLLLTHLRPEDPALTRLQRRSRRTKGVYEAQVLAKSQFDKDKSLYSIASGTNDIIRRCREGLQSVPGAMELLNKLVDFDPVKRPTLKQVMYHPVFSGYRLCDDATPPDYVISYYKNRHQGGHMIPDV